MMEFRYLYFCFGYLSDVKVHKKCIHCEDKKFEGFHTGFPYLVTV